MKQGCFFFLSCNFDVYLNSNCRRFVIYAYAEIHQVKKVVFDNYQRCLCAFNININFNFCIWPCFVSVPRVNRPVRLMLDRNEDMLITGTRHPILGRYRAGVSKSGQLRALHIDLYANCGHTYDCSAAVSISQSVICFSTGGLAGWTCPFLQILTHFLEAAVGWTGFAQIVPKKHKHSVKNNNTFRFCVGVNHNFVSDFGQFNRIWITSYTLLYFFLWRCPYYCHQCFAAVMVQKDWFKSIGVAACLHIDFSRNKLKY